jgi:hypothetical protein
MQKSLKQFNESAYKSQSLAKTSPIDKKSFGFSARTQTQNFKNHNHTTVVKAGKKKRGVNAGYHHSVQTPLYRNPNVLPSFGP